MTRKRIKSSTDQRPFSMIYHDFLKGIKNGLLDNHYQIVVYIYLKMFADSKNQCYPSIKTLTKLTNISEKKIRTTLTELEKKGMITKENRTRSDGGKSSNLYTVHDYTEIWNTGNDKEITTIINEHEEMKLVAELRLRGYHVTKEKELVSEPTKAHTQALKSNKPNQFDDTTNSVESQEQERYTLDQIHQLFDYDIMVQNNSDQQQDIDSVMNILHMTLNTKKPTIRINSEDKPTMVVISKLMKLTMDEIIYCIDTYAKQTERIKNPINYMLTLLYQAKEQMNFDITNQVRHNMAYWNK